MEVVEENIVCLKARKCIQQTADNRKIFISHEFSYVCVCGCGGKGVFQAEQRSHKERHNFSRERDSQPEERTSEEVERIRTEEVCTEVRSPIPHKFSRPYDIMSVHIERNLLGIIVAVVNQITLCVNQQGYYHYSEYYKADYKGKKIFFAVFLHQWRAEFF